MYNPHEGWGHELKDSLAEINAHFKDIDFSVAIVNDGSTKNVEVEMKVIRETYAFVEYLTYPTNRGKGHAIREGAKMISSDFYIYTDWDFPFGQRAVYEAYRLLATQSFDLVIGKRDDTYFKSLPFWRKIISKSLLAVNFITTGFKVSDTQAGLKGLNRAACSELLRTKVNSFIFEWEFIRYCLKKNMSFQFIDISVENPLKFSNFKLRTILHELTEYFKILTRLR